MGYCLWVLFHLPFYMHPLICYFLFSSLSILSCSMMSPLFPCYLVSVLSNGYLLQLENITGHLDFQIFTGTDNVELGLLFVVLFQIGGSMYYITTTITKPQHQTSWGRSGYDSDEIWLLCKQLSMPKFFLDMPRTLVKTIGRSLQCCFLSNVLSNSQSLIGYLC